MSHLQIYSASGAELAREVESLGRDIEFYKASGASSNRWYPGGAINCTALSTATPVIDTFYALPFVSPRGGSLDRLAFNITTVGGAGSLSRAGIYANTSSSVLYPSSLVVDGGAFDSSAVGGTGAKVATIAADLDAGELYWVAFLCGVAAPIVRSIATAGLYPIFGLDSTLSTAPGVGLTVAQAYGALPGTFPAAATVITAAPIPAVFVRYSA